MRNFRCGLFDVIHAIKMGVVNAGQIDRCTPTLDRLTFIQQHANSHRFEIGNHANSIVIAEHSVDRPLAD